MATARINPSSSGSATHVSAGGRSDLLAFVHNGGKRMKQAAIGENANVVLTAKG